MLIPVGASGKELTVNGRATDRDGTYYVDEGNDPDLSVRNIIVKRDEASTKDYSIFRTEETVDVEEQWNLTFRNLTMQNGKANAKDTGNKGGALYVSGVTSILNLYNVLILDSSASYGGAIYNSASSGNAILNVLNSTMYGNTLQMVQVFTM